MRSAESGSSGGPEPAFSEAEHKMAYEHMYEYHEPGSEPGCPMCKSHAPAGEPAPK